MSHTKVKKLFISGPMTGLPDDNFPAFNFASYQLRAVGVRVENPAENPAQPDWQSYLRQAIRQLSYCDGVWLLQGWEDSRGAQLEHEIAIRLGLPVFYPGERFDLALKALADFGFVQEREAV
jgi:hypothetical protein